MILTMCEVQKVSIVDVAMEWASSLTHVWRHIVGILGPRKAAFAQVNFIGT